MTIAVLATLQVDEGHADAVRTALLHLAEQARYEDGTQLFAVNEAIYEPGHFVVFERYRDEAAVTAHRTSAAMDEFRAALRRADTSPDILFLTPLAGTVV
jgi:quinol monooxygenase YgiN